MSDYRKRFVQFNMLLIGIVLTVMVAAVAVYMGRDYYTGLRSTMEQVVAPLHAFSQERRRSLAKIGRPFPGGSERKRTFPWFSTLRRRENTPFSPAATI